MDDALSWAGFIVSVFALVISAIAEYTSWKTQRRLVAIEEDREKERQLASRQACLRPELRKTGRHSYRLYIVNTGRAEARNVRVKLDGKPLAMHCAYVQGDEVPTHIGPDSEVSCLLALSLGCSPPFDIEIEWEDDSGLERTYRSTLTF